MILVGAGDHRVGPGAGEDFGELAAGGGEGAEAAQGAGQGESPADDPQRAEAGSKRRHGGSCPGARGLRGGALPGRWPLRPASRDRAPGSASNSTRLTSAPTEDVADVVDEQQASGTGGRHGVTRRSGWGAAATADRNGRRKAVSGATPSRRRPPPDPTARHRPGSGGRVPRAGARGRGWRAPEGDAGKADGGGQVGDAGVVAHEQFEQARSRPARSVEGQAAGDVGSGRPEALPGEALQPVTFGLAADEEDVAVGSLDPRPSSSAQRRSGQFLASEPLPGWAAIQRPGPGGGAGSSRGAGFRLRRWPGVRGGRGRCRRRGAGPVRRGGGGRR
jgi:hypothetical protein